MSRFATIQICDEVAQIGMGKSAFVGTYNAEMLVPSIPMTLQQIYFVVRFRSDINDPPSRFVVRIERPGQQTYVADHSAAIPKPTNPPPKEATFFAIQAIIRIAPFEITEIGTIRVYVDDEIGENYAGGLRIKVGVHPDQAGPQTAICARLVAGHYQRLEDLSEVEKSVAARQLIEALRSYMTFAGSPPLLNVPDGDVRIQLDQNRVQVFFPRPKAASVSIEIEPGNGFDSATVEHKDELGFVARFEPSAPPDSNFNYEVLEAPLKKRKPGGAQRRKGAKTKSMN